MSNGCIINKNRTDRKPPSPPAPEFKSAFVSHWKIEIFKNGEHIETKCCEGDSITDLMALLESEKE